MIADVPGGVDRGVLAGAGAARPDQAADPRCARCLASHDPQSAPEATRIDDLRVALPQLATHGIPLRAGNALAGRSIAASDLRHDHGVTVLAVNRAWRTLANLRRDPVREAEDVSVVIGPPGLGSRAQLSCSVTLTVEPVAYRASRWLRRCSSSSVRVQAKPQRARTRSEASRRAWTPRCSRSATLSASPGRR